MLQNQGEEGDKTDPRRSNETEKVKQQVDDLRRTKEVLDAPWREETLEEMCSCFTHTTPADLGRCHQRQQQQHPSLPCCIFTPTDTADDAYDCAAQLGKERKQKKRKDIDVVEDDDVVDVVSELPGIGFNFAVLATAATQQTETQKMASCVVVKQDGANRMQGIAEGSVGCSGDEDIEELDIDKEQPAVVTSHWDRASSAGAAGDVGNLDDLPKMSEVQFDNFVDEEEGQSNQQTEELSARRHLTRVEQLRGGNSNKPAEERQQQQEDETDGGHIATDADLLVAPVASSSADVVAAHIEGAEKQQQQQQQEGQTTVTGEGEGCCWEEEVAPFALDTEFDYDANVVGKSKKPVTPYDV